MDTYTITIDGGTTNTRCILWNSSRQRIDEQKRVLVVPPSIVIVYVSISDCPF